MADKLDLVDIGEMEPVPPVTVDGVLVRNDGWKNVLSGMGTTRDKRRYTTYDYTYLMDSITLSNMYLGEGLTARIIDTFADDMTREWGYAKNDPVPKGATQGIIETEMERLDVSTQINTAVKWARLHGGSLLFIGAVDGEQVQARLNIEKVKSIEFLRVIELPDILTEECVYDKNINSPNYGNIEQYCVNVRAKDTVTKVFIHASRCIPFFGRKVPSSHTTVSASVRYWGISELQGVYEYLRDFTSAMGSTSSILMEFIIGKYKFSDLDEMLAKGGETRLKTRIEAIDMTKSILHSVLLGTDEEYTRDSATVTGIADLLDRFMMNLSAVTQYPVTKLFGRSPAGLNATGENDLKNYYDAVKSKQRSTTKYIQNLIAMIVSYKGLSGDFPWEWNPLFQLSEKDKAEVGRIEAESERTLAAADQLMLQEAVLEPEEVWKMRYEAVLGPKDFGALLPEPDERHQIPEGVEEGKEGEEGDETDPKERDKEVPENAE